MKRLLLFIVLAVFSLQVTRGNITWENLPPEAANILHVQQCTRTADGLTLSLSFEAPVFETIGESGSLQLASFAGKGMRNDPGEPATPTIGRLFRLPPTGGVTVEVLDFEFETLTGVDYAACSSELDEIEYGSCANRDAWFPEALVEVSDPAIFHDFRVASLLTNPVQVNPARNEVRVYSRMNVAIRFDGNDNRNSIPTQPVKLSSTFLPWYREFLDWDDNELDEFEFYEGNVVVVMRDDEVLWEAMEEWIAWKRQKGWKLDFLTDAGFENWTADDIITELCYRYETAEEKFDIVVIVGDDTGSFPVPASSGSGVGHGDIHYARLAGDDWLVDVAVGRMSVESLQEVVLVTSKTINYELYPFMDDTGWYQRASLYRSDSHAGISKIMTLRYWRRLLFENGYAQVDTNWNHGHTPIIEAINNGVSVYSHRGYLGTGLQITDVNNLSNDFMLPAVVDLTCYTGNWSNSLGINESWLRAGTVQTPTGGIGAIGMTTAANCPNFNNCISGGTAHTLLVHHNPEFGRMWLGAQINLWQNFHLHDPTYMNNEQQWCNLMGDPTTWLWTAVPESLNLDVQNQLYLGENQVIANVTDNSGDPVSEAWVTFYKANNNEDVVYSTQTDANGDAILQTLCRFTGSGTITASKRNCIPATVQATISNSEDVVSFEDFLIIDDGSNGTQGNGDGIPQNGETVGLRLKLVCQSGIAQTGIIVSGSSEDRGVTSVTGNILRGMMNPGEAVWETDVLLVELSGTITDHWIIHIDLNFSSDQSHHVTTCSFPVRSPQYGLVFAEMSDISPGDEGEITITIQNTGGHFADNAMGTLYSLQGMILGNNESMILGDIAVGDTATAVFSISSEETVLPGIMVPVLLALTSENGHMYDLFFSVNFGGVDATDVTGPDQYGYIAVENTDIVPGDSLVPDYNWIEINPDAPDPDFQGTLLDLEDLSENDDEAISIPLPFTIQYYGNSFDTLTVSTNGYVAMGNQADLSLARNWTIPSPLGPNNMIAPYWDELQTNGDAAIVTYHDDGSGIFIVEFYRMRHHNYNYESTFELLFYDTEHYPTFTNDNRFLFQYGLCEHSTGGMSYDIPFWTTGIENGNQTDGLQLAYRNTMNPTIARIDSGRAILFSVAFPQVHVVASGQVVTAADNQPVPNALVYTEPFNSVVADSMGFFNLDLYSYLSIDIFVEKECFNLQVHHLIPYEDDIQNITIALTQPSFSLDRHTIMDTLANNETASHSVFVENAGDGTLTSSLTFEVCEPEIHAAKVSPRWISELDEQWTRIPGFQLSTEEFNHYGITYDGNNFWIAGANSANPDAPNLLYKYSVDGTMISSCPQPVPEDQRSYLGMRNLTWEDGCLYGVDNYILYEMTPVDDTMQVNFQVDVPLPRTRFLAVDSFRGLFWMKDITSNMYGINLNGNIEYAFEDIPYDIYGGDMLRYSNCNNNLGLLTWYHISHDIRLLEFNPDTEVFQNLTDTSLGALEESPGGACFFCNGQQSSWNFATIASFEDADSVLIWEIEPFDEWLYLPESYIELPPGGLQEIPIQLSSMFLPPGTYSLDLVFDYNACSEVSNRVLIRMTVSSTSSPEEPTGRPLEWKLDAIWPNPFNPTAQIRYGIKEATRVDIRVYDILGREVTVLAHESQAAGWHTVPFTAPELASGVYFLRIHAGPLRETRKLILLK